MKSVTVQELHIYPVKGCGGGPVDTLTISAEGIVGDREFSFVDEDSRLVDQKDTPLLASIKAKLTSQGLEFHHATAGIFTHQTRTKGESIPAKWVIDKLEGMDQGDAIAEWVTNIIGKTVRLIRIDKPWTINFPVPDMARLHGKSKQRFTGASELSLTNRASLDALNETLDHPVSMDRFRSNIVVDGIEAFEEDDMQMIGNDAVEILQVTAAERCVIIDTDQTTGERPIKVLKALSKIRTKTEGKFGSGIIFGNYMTINKPGILNIGDCLAFQPYDDVSINA